MGEWGKGTAAKCLWRARDSLAGETGEGVKVAVHFAFKMPDHEARPVRPPRPPVSDVPHAQTALEKSFFAQTLSRAPLPSSWRAPRAKLYLQQV